MLENILHWSAVQILFSVIKQVELNTFLWAIMSNIIELVMTDSCQGEGKKEQIKGR